VVKASKIGSFNNPRKRLTGMRAHKATGRRTPRQKMRSAT
jgi:hypothetical protein